MYIWATNKAVNMNEKQLLRVCKKSSKAVKRCYTTILMLAYLFLAVGIVYSMIMLIDEDYESLILGLSTVLCAILLFCVSALIKGFKTIVEVSECRKAIIEKKFSFPEDSSKKTNSWNNFVDVLKQ